MTGGTVLEQIKIEYRNIDNNDIYPVYIDIFDNSLSHKWLKALNDILKNNLVLEKNYCFMGWIENQRNGEYILNQVNQTIHAINEADIGYTINDHFSLDDTITDDASGRRLIHDRMNNLHRYFEDTQGVSGAISDIALRASPLIKWHIRQLNLLCHEFESWALSYRKELTAPEWRCPSQLMCWLHAPRFILEKSDYDCFGVETLNRPHGAVYVGVNKAVGKHHWEVFKDEGRDSRIDELVTTTLRSQTEAAGDFDIEWGRSAEKIESRKRELSEFKEWLIANEFDPEDKSLTIGHPMIGKVNFDKSFRSSDPQNTWQVLGNYLDVFSVSTSDNKAIYNYHWSDKDYVQRQVEVIGG